MHFCLTIVLNAIQFTLVYAHIILLLQAYMGYYSEIAYYVYFTQTNNLKIGFHNMFSRVAFILFRFYNGIRKQHST